MEHVVTIDNGAPLAFDRTPLSIARKGMRGPRTPFSPEHTVVPLPDTNPEEEESLAGALERQGTTSGRQTWGANQSTVTDDGPYHHGFLYDMDACVVTSTDEAHQSTPDGAY